MPTGCGAGPMGELGEEALDEVEPGAMLGCERELEAPAVEWRAKF